MKRKELYQLIQPLTEKLYSFAYSLLPDDLQAEQLVIDGVNAYLLKERKKLYKWEIELNNRKETLVLRKMVFKQMLHYLSDIGVRRSLQMAESMRQNRPQEFARFFDLDPKTRIVVRMRYDSNFSVDEITDILQIPRYEVIEKIHNGRFLMMSEEAL